MATGHVSRGVEFPGHVGAALAAYSPVAFVALRSGATRLAFVGALVTVALASLPDVDHHAPRVAHRGLSHTVWFATVVGAGCAAVFPLAGVDRHAILTLGPGVDPLATLPLAAFGFAVGAIAICSHLAADSLTPMGVAPLAPLWRRRYSFGVTRSADPIANRLMLLFGLAVAVVTVMLGTNGSPVG